MTKTDKEAHMSDTLPPGARIFLVDDHPAVLDGLSLLLAQDSHTVCAEAKTHAEALERMADSAADLALVDLALCGESGLELIPAFRACRIPVLVYSMHEDPGSLRRALEHGASGYVTKREPSSVLLGAVRAVLAGERFVSPRMAEAYDASAQAAPAVQPRPEAQAPTDTLAPEPPPQALSERESQILELLSLGESNAEIAATLQVSVRTVETYCARMLVKLSLDGMKALRKHAIQMRKPS